MLPKVFGQRVCRREKLEVFHVIRRHIDVVFSGEDFSNQPKYVVDTGSGDGLGTQRL